MTSTVEKTISAPWQQRDNPEEVPTEEKVLAQSNPAPTHGKLFLELLIFLVPAIWLGSLVLVYGVNSPWGDQWDGTFPLFAKMHAGTLGLSDFFAFHSEHRIFFPSLISFLLAKVTHWDIRAELFVIWLLTCVCAYNVWRITHLTDSRRLSSQLILWLCASILVFTPVPWENLFWGFQIGFLLPLACMTALPWVAFSLRQPANFVCLILLCLVSTFSIASGFAAWVLSTGLLAIANGKPKSRFELWCWGGWLCIAMASITAYFHGFRRPEWHPSELEALHHPWLALQFVLTYLGFPFSIGTPLDVSVLASIVGGLLLTILFLAIVYLWRERRDRRLIRESSAWLALIGIALVNCLLTMIGRSGFGISAAMQWRYVSFAVFLPIGLLFLCSDIFQHWSDRQSSKIWLRKWILRGSIIFSLSLGLLLGLATTEVLAFLPVLQHERFSGKAILLLSNILDEPEAFRRYLHPSPDVKSWAGTLKELGYIRPLPLQSNRIAEIAKSTSGEVAGAFQHLGRTADGGFVVSGWAILPWKDRVADSVLLTSENESNDPLIFARIDVKKDRQDVVKAMGEESYSNCGWARSFTPQQIPAGTRLIKAWAFDAEERQAFLIGSAPL